MFQMNESTIKLLEDFHLPFGGKMGQKAYSVRIALGALIIKERLGLSDRETTLQIMENPYLQFFLGFPGYLDQEPFHHSLLTHFRTRLGADILAEVNDWIATESLKAEQEAASKPKEEDDKNDDDNDPGNGQFALEVGEAFTVPEPEERPARPVRRAMKTLKVLPSKWREDKTNGRDADAGCDMRAGRHQVSDGFGLVESCP